MVTMTFMIVRHCSELRQQAAIMKRRSRHNLLIAVATAMGAQLVCNTAAQEPCKLAAIGTTIVAAVRDGRTLLLANGRELRLGGIEVTDDSRATLQPWSPDVRCDSNGSGLATTATAAWSHLLFRALLREALQQTVFEHIDACGRQSLRGCPFKRRTRGAV
jgi:hypothetical protein